MKEIKLKTKEKGQRKIGEHNSKERRGTRMEDSPQVDSMEKMKKLQEMGI